MGESVLFKCYQINLFLSSSKLHHQRLLLLIPAVLIRDANTLFLHFTVSCEAYLQHLHIYIFLASWITNCHQSQHLHGAVETICCSPTSYQCKQQAHSLSNESPCELTLLAFCLNTVQMLQSLSFSFPCLFSHTITHWAAVLNKLFKITGDNSLSAPASPVFCLDVTRQWNSSGTAGVTLTLTWTPFSTAASCPSTHCFTLNRGS